MKAYFEQFGVVTDCVVMRDPMQSRGVKKNRLAGLQSVCVRERERVRERE